MIATTATDSPARRSGKGFVLAILWLLFLASCCLAPAAQQRGTPGYFLIPGDAKAGLKVFYDKGCVRCHSVLGEGGKSAPDLGRAPGGHLSAAEMVAAMWNHAPQMWGRMREKNLKEPAFAAGEMSNLFAFLYSVRSMDEPGDPQRGRLLLTEKHCRDCHATPAGGKQKAPDLREWGSYRNPVSWIQAMWNHAPRMQAEMEARRLPWPEFQGSDVADLIAYVRTQTTNPRQHFYLQPASPELGKQLFHSKGCANCHSLHGPVRAGAPDLGAHSLPRTLGQFAAQMWNHSPVMWASMRARNISRPQFSNKEMADLIAYLFAERYFEAAGNFTNGRRIFEEKGCAACHLADGSGPGPALSVWRGRVSPVALATAMWNHGPAMLGRMKEQQVPWPVFRPNEMVDLMEYLNRESAGRSGREPRSCGRPNPRAGIKLGSHAHESSG